MSEGWSEQDVPDQTGTTALITGANSGIGWEAARVLCGAGAHVVLACRNRAKADAAAERITSAGPSGTVEVLDLDLADLESVKAAAQAFLGAHSGPDLLINNAGLMAPPLGRTAQGFEMQFGVNHLGHFALTGHLIESLLATPGSRVVTVSSMGHRPGRIDFDDLNSEHGYKPWAAYFQSKLANLLFTFELQRRLDAAGEGTTAVAAHPGGSNTNLGHESAGGVLHTLMKVGRPLASVVTQPAAMGALPTLRAATDPSVRGGDYFGPDGFMEQRGHPVRVESSTRAQDGDTGRRLWAVSEELTDVHYDALA